ncbi:hypothetical protein Z959_03790 [Clostridium novyi B str. ATCC 27606]|uniref:NusG domain-containing protein n=2 Tax=Clostridium TaxID=1485 RepID=A0AA40ISI2_CLONO|nr:MULTISPECIES: NusG domain II-containing protein [Clostridium]KEI12702.1 hypothetical protein Z959_03790 [Clostridium novyi B str. ATCC 27606]KEI14735.1 hypothetical protein Z958_09900 [Clostridium novyi B str. NCTC 9691]KEI15922.1 hypothetical protein Z960_11325 [Clostridium haemolyticum NCTC 9693]KGN00273.1 hypothetical protein Z961_11010 [Clostridium haemolyticum NCTC 8350]OOB75685.1 hypothetical protein AXF41_07335 [Clostridium haemolyticum]
MKKIDKIIIIVCLIVSVVGIGILRYNSSKKYNEKYAEINVKGKLYKKVILDNKRPKETLNIKTDLGENIIEIENGGLRILDANCSDKICVKDGFKYKVGDMLVCLPHKVIINIKGDNRDREIDDVSQ